jgi:hypothetical protein
MNSMGSMYKEYGMKRATPIFAQNIPLLIDNVPIL